MDRFDPFVKYADVYGDIINWEKDPMNKPQNQNKYFFSDGKTYYEQICKMLRLMSVFKEAFNQIYSNEDEISEAWENFVNNLSASVVEGSEPDVTLTWTDDSVNFEFTMVPGVPGEQGVGITSISFNSDYTMTITLSDGNTYTSMSLKGETGPQGPQGETGSGLQILDVYASLADLQSAHPTGQPGDAYQVGSAGNYTLYIWSSSQSAWVQAGTLGTVSPSVSNPLMDGTASAGSQNLYSRGDHVHPTDTSRASQEELDALIKTSQSLIDQSFTYRESPAIQDGIAKIESIKGNTIIENDTLIPFNGTGLKTIGKNLWNIPTYSITWAGVTITSNKEEGIKIKGTSTASGSINEVGCYVKLIGGKTYTISGITDGGVSRYYIQGVNEEGTTQLFIVTNSPYQYTPANDETILLRIRIVSGVNIDTVIKAQCEIGSSVTDYEAYREETLSLPISQYFPTGMKSAGNVYDELTESKAITRIGELNIDSSTTIATWESNVGWTANIILNTYKPNGGIKSDKFEYIGSFVGASSFATSARTKGGYCLGVLQNGNRVYFYSSSATTSNDLINAIRGTNLYYELATPTETAVELDLDFMAYEDGTEQLLPVNGSVPVTSPVIADMTYLSIDDAMEYIIDKLANVPQNTQQILDSLEDDVADLQTDIDALQPAVSALQTSVGNINTNIGQLSSTVAGHTSSISDMQSDISDLNTGLSDLEDTVTDNTSRIGTLESGLSTTNGNVQSLSSQVQSIDGRVTNLESDMFKIVVKEFDYDTVASETNFGTTTPITQEEGYRVIGVVGTETQAGEHTSPASNIAITQCHVYYTSLGALIITIFGRNTGPSTRTNVRVYAYLLCIKDIQ